MANPTTSLAAYAVRTGEEFIYWPTDPAVTVKFVPNEMVGVRISDGYIDHFDDTKYMMFLGLAYDGYAVPHPMTEAGPKMLRVRTAMRFAVALASGSGARPPARGVPPRVPRPGGGAPNAPVRSPRLTPTRSRSDTQAWSRATAR